MSLRIYRSVDEVPEGIRVVMNNNLFFDARTLIRNDALVLDILKSIDKAVYNSELTFIGRTLELGALSKSMLSTGTKTLLNIISYPDKCFNVVECGNNALKFIPKLKQGHILWEMPVVVCRDKPECDIEYRGIHYTDFHEFLSKVEEEERL